MFGIALIYNRIVSQRREPTHPGIKDLGNENEEMLKSHGQVSDMHER